MSTEQEPTVREVATVFVKDAVDGTVKRKARGKGKRPNSKVTTLSLDDCLPEIAAAARSCRKPGQVFRVVSATEVLVVNR